MANHYVELPRKDIEEVLTDAGFSPVRDKWTGRELVYQLAHKHDPRVTVRVYTSVPTHGSRGRECDADAIRVFARFTWQHHETGRDRTKVLYRARVLRVNSVEGILGRTLERARDAYRAGNVFLRKRAA